MALDVNETWMQVHTRLRDFIVRRVPNNTEADDILQEVFLRMHQGLETLKDPGRVVSWVFQITRNVIADYYRASTRRREIAVGMPTELEATLPNPGHALHPDSFESGQIQKELASCLLPMINQMSDRYREALRLVEFDGLTQKAAAKQLGVSLSGMKSRVQRGRRELKNLMEECCVIQLDRRSSITDYTVRNSDCKSCEPSPKS